MEIVKFEKLKNEKYRIFLDVDIEYILYDDVILKYNLLYNRQIDVSLLKEIIEYNDQFEYYEKTLTFIQKRVRSKLEVEKYLKDKKVSDENIEVLINKFLNNGLINDDIFLSAFINDKVNLSTDGVGVIKRELLRHNIDEVKIDLLLDEIDYEVWYNKALKIGNKVIKSNTKFGKSYLVNNIYAKLKTLGYNSDVIEDVMLELDFSLISNRIIENEYNKINNKYSKKYDGYELKKVIYNKLLSKGFNSDEIKKLIN